VNPAQVMPGADADAIRPRVVAAVRPKLKVMIVQIAARLARRHRTPPAVAREDRIRMPRLRASVT
jgi:hypothetical protein